MTENIRLWDALAGEYRTMQVEVPDQPGQRGQDASRAKVKRGAPRDTSGLSSGSPIPAWWRDTAYAPSDGFADARTYVKPASMRTHRAATVMPADPGRLTARKPSDRLDA